jgi:hypothetical protein
VCWGGFRRPRHHQPRGDGKVLELHAFFFDLVDRVQEDVVTDANRRKSAITLSPEN